ncbi:hypothetical protein DERP_004496 [Dermatophagoides pteronyssinus]|uniref:Uncharacterized protein n=1 Tax=Dermatophagoides pteronyssinus TaxID=6956 RepID=A0ABQ8JNY1_DERPT|nr:hypothetical protein DERP_004496 [Dermatophagoides pteronyssinus]
MPLFFYANVILAWLVDNLSISIDENFPDNSASNLLYLIFNFQVYFSTTERKEERKHTEQKPQYNDDDKIVQKENPKE